MKEITLMLVGVLMASLIVLGGTQLFSDMGTANINLPGASEGEKLKQKIDNYIPAFEDVAEEESGSIGFLGLAGLIKVILLDAPMHAVNFIGASLGAMGVNYTVVTFIGAALIVVMIAAAILLLRGVKA